MTFSYSHKGRQVAGFPQRIPFPPIKLKFRTKILFVEKEMHSGRHVMKKSNHHWALSMVFAESSEYPMHIVSITCTTVL